MIKRNTIQCALVLAAVNKLQNHATAEEIYDKVNSEQPHISRATVYRNLNKLVASGQVRRLKVPNSSDRFDHLCHDHYHVRCVNCGKVFDVDMDYIDNLEEKIKDSRGIKFVGYTLVFEGICLQCNMALSKEC